MRTVYFSFLFAVVFFSSIKALEFITTPEERSRTLASYISSEIAPYELRLEEEMMINQKTFRSQNNGLALYRYFSHLMIPASKEAHFLGENILNLTHHPHFAEELTILESKIHKINNPENFPDCSLEVGHSSYNGDYSYACRNKDFSLGLARDYQFPLRKYLSCIRHQGKRPTCTVFSTLGALEIELAKKYQSLFNLSEQHGFFFGKSVLPHKKRYSFHGLETVEFLRNLTHYHYPIQFESVWPYNPSMQIYAYDQKNNKLLGSCLGYLAGPCSEYSFQAAPSFPFLLKSSRLDYPNIPKGMASARTGEFVALFNEFQKNESIQLSRYLLQKGIPQILVYKNFPLSAPKGLIGVHNKGETTTHSLTLVGFIPKNKIQSQIPRPRGNGYFIAKNSWGPRFGDCGFVYIDEAAMIENVIGLFALSGDISITK